LCAGIFLGLSTAFSSFGFPWSCFSGDFCYALVFPPRQRCGFSILTLRNRMFSSWFLFRSVIFC
jgi:hypothetical protein